ncbi:MAG TPA: PQQ-binding-like beta-propeller repeat protein [Bacteroidales bacterium]|nr:PQQ-binding-like beta-propeller repeat protein [Bacteroidales bacterium]
MKKIVVLISSIFLIVVSSFAQDWPQFRGIDRDSKVTGFKSPATWPAELKQVWKIKVGTGDATPALVNKKIYLNTRQGDDEIVLCLDAASGKEFWRNQYSSPAVTGPAGSHPGPRSTPAVSNGKVVTFGAAGILSCLDAATGKILWRKENPDNAIPQFFTGMSPLIVENSCIAHIGAKDKGEVVAFDLNTGNEKWKWSGDGPAYASPSVMVVDGKKTIVVQTEKNLVGLDFRDGKLLWQMATPVNQRFYNCVSPYINGKTIYVTGQGTGVKAINVEGSVKDIWTNAEVGAKWNTPVLKDGFLYGFTDQKRIYCINAGTGATAWIDNTVNSDFATLSDCGEVLIGLPSTGNLIVFKPDPKAYSEVAKYKVSETPVYAFPVIAGNNIYIKDAENLILFKIL